MRLSNLQQYWQNYVFDGDIALIKPEISQDAEERLEIYADGYEARLIESMEKIFPFLTKYMEEELFDESCSEYLHQNPSTFFSISQIGHLLDIFLKNKNLLIESEIASLEWAIHQAQDAADASALTESDLQKISEEKWGSVILECHPSLQLLLFDYNTLSIYEAINKNEVEKRSTFCRVWRKGLQTYYRSIQEAEFIFLKNIQKKISFAEICENLINHMTEEEIGQTISRWLQDEIITDIKVSQ
jgi:hypothetical protein